MGSSSFVMFVVSFIAIGCQADPRGPVIGIMTEKTDSGLHCSLMPARQCLKDFFLNAPPPPLAKPNHCACSLPPFAGKLGTSYIAASYVKYLESAGARVVPVHYQYNTAQLAALFGKLNGVLFPGGAIDVGDPTNPLLIAGKTMYNLAIKANAAGDYFPVWVG